ncbi:MAG: SAM-dependent methyltransferase [Verrucomicrobiales bacterium]|jgi:SAM-dependent methyltransferase
MPAIEKRDWYETPLYYDIVFDSETDVEADFLEAMHERHGTGTTGKSRSVLEPACGSGRLVREMAWRGWAALGFDLSPAMLEFARSRCSTEGVAADLWEDRLEGFQISDGRQVDLAHCLVTTFKYLLTEEDAIACLERVAESLKPGGLFVLGLHLTAYTSDKISHERWVEERDGYKVVCNTRTWPADRESRLERLRTRLRVTHPDGETHTQETNWHFRTYNARELRSLIEKVPAFELVDCHDFNCDPESTRPLNDLWADIILILRK